MADRALELRRRAAERSRRRNGGKVIPLRRYRCTANAAHTWLAQPDPDGPSPCHLCGRPGVEDSAANAGR